MSDTLDMAIVRARATPQKPYGTYYQRLRCPTCMARLPSGEGSSRGTPRAYICNNCFQVIDWSDRDPARWGSPPLGYREMPKGEDYLRETANCINTNCKYHNTDYDQYCQGELSNGEPAIIRCKEFMPG